MKLMIVENVMKCSKCSEDRGREGVLMVVSIMCRDYREQSGAF